VQHEGQQQSYRWSNWFGFFIFFSLKTKKKTLYNLNSSVKIKIFEYIIVTKLPLYNKLLTNVFFI